MPGGKSNGGGLSANQEIGVPREVVGGFWGNKKTHGRMDSAFHRHEKWLPKLDKTIGAKPFLAVKSSLETFPGAVSVQDFDFISQQFFTVWGFNDTATLFEFSRLWQIDGKAHRELTAEIDQRRSELLGAWAASEPQQQAA